MKNIMLMFLSDVKTRKEGDKVKINETLYTNVDGEKTLTTNESAVRYLIKTTPLDKIFIFASKKVRGEIAFVNRKTKESFLYFDDNQKTWTHLDFSRERFKKFLPGVGDDFFDSLDFDETQSDDENLKSVAQMAGLIQDFAAPFGFKNVTLHVDLTGGMRHVNMMMLELTRLLEYSGLKVGKVLYSNYNNETDKGTVEEIQNVYDLFQLIAGVEEFVNFGSVKALTGEKGYYKGKTLPAPLQKLLDAMENFAAAIKLCHYGQFSAAIKNLHAAVHDFDKQKSDDAEYVLMSRLIGRIRDRYKDLIAFNEKDDLRVIRWCLENDYLQQALTLCTERIPEYLGEKKVITQTEAEAAKLTELVENDRRNRYYYLLNVLTSNKDHTDKAFKKFCDAVKSETVGKKSVDVDAWLKSLNARLAKFNVTIDDEPRLRKQIETFNELRQNPDILLELESPELDPIREIVNELADKLVAEEKPHLRRKIIFDFVNQLKNERSKQDAFKVIKDIFVNELADKLVAEENSSVRREFVSDFVKQINIARTNQDRSKIFKDFFPGVVFAKNISEKFPHLRDEVYKLLVDKVFFVDNQEAFLAVMEKYFRIQNERNHSNHARADEGEFKTAEELREFMNGTLDDIEKILPAQ